MQTLMLTLAALVGDEFAVLHWNISFDIAFINWGLLSGVMGN